MGINSPNIHTNKQFFDALANQKDEIEQKFGAPLDWNRADDFKSSTIRYKIPGGGLTNQEQWLEIQDRMIDAMIRLETALHSHIQQL